MSVTASMVAKELGVAERTVRRWIASGELQAVKQHGVFGIDLDAAREVYQRSRANRISERSLEIAELRGRYLEVCERLKRVEHELEEERRRTARLKAILAPQDKEGA